MTDKNIKKQLTAWPPAESELAESVPSPSSTYHLPPAPIEVFPAEIQELITRAVETFGTTVEIVMSAILAISGGLIGRRRLLLIKADWDVHAALYWLVVALTGESKSPVINWLMRPIEAIERRLLDDYRLKLAEYESDLANRKKGDEPLKEPARLQIKVGDVTIEQKASILEANPGGILEYRDEASGFIGDEDKYHGAKGSDRSKHLEIYDRRAMQVDRKSGPPVYVPEPSLGRFGGTQPKVLVDCFSDQDAAAGALGRYISIHSEQTKPAFWSEKTMAAEDAFLWDNLINRFFDYDMPEDEKGWCNGRKIKVSAPAKELYIDYYNELSAKPYVDPSAIRETLPKAREHCLRLCLNLHCIEHATPGTNELTPVTADTMQKAITLARWVYAHNVKTWEMVVGRMDAPEQQPLKKRIAQAIIDLKDEINGGVLATSEITERVNSGYPEKFKSSSKSIGRFCSSRLDLQKSSDTSKRGWMVGPGTLERLKNDFNLNANACDACDACDPLEKTLTKPEIDQASKAFKAFSVCKNQENEEIPKVANSDFEVF